jgi:hypothetical protein
MRDDLRQAALALVKRQTGGNSLSHGTRLKTVPLGQSSRSVLVQPNETFMTVGAVRTAGTNDNKWHVTRDQKLDIASIEERTALVQYDGGVPQHYALAFAEMQHECPNDVAVERWEQFLNDAGVFLDQWGNNAHAFGWRIHDLFGLDTKSPLARFDKMGLCWLIKGQTVVAIAANAARLSGGLTYYRSDDAVDSR